MMAVRGEGRKNGCCCTPSSSAFLLWSLRSLHSDYKCCLCQPVSAAQPCTAEFTNCLCVQPQTYPRVLTILRSTWWISVLLPSRPVGLRIKAHFPVQGPRSQLAITLHPLWASLQALPVLPDPSIHSPLTNNSIITWELIKNAESWVSPWLLNKNQHFNKNPQWFLCTLKFEK